MKFLFGFLNGGIMILKNIAIHKQKVITDILKFLKNSNRYLQSCHRIYVSVKYLVQNKTFIKTLALSLQRLKKFYWLNIFFRIQILFLKNPNLKNLSYCIKISV